MYEINIAFVAFFVFLAGIISLKLKIPPVLLELIAGLIVGNLFIFQANPSIDILSGMGILVLMYIAGLEIDFDFLKSKIKPSLHIGIPIFFVPFGLISFFCFYIYHFSFVQAILIALALSTTSIAIVFPVLCLKGKLDERDKTIISAVMIVDILSMIFLGFFSSAFSFFTVFFIIAMGMLAYFFPFLGARFLKNRKKNIIELELKFVLFSLLALSFMSEHAGIEPTLIAFFFGMLTSEFVVGHIELQKQLNGIAFGFLTPIFFFMAGTKVSILLAFKNPLFIAALFTIVCFSKYYTALFTIKKYFKTKVRYYAKLFNFCLTFGLIVITLALEKGIINTELFSVIGVIIILSSLVGFFSKEK